MNILAIIRVGLVLVGKIEGKMASCTCTHTKRVAETGNRDPSRYKSVYKEYDEHAIQCSNYRAPQSVYSTWKRYHPEITPKHKLFDAGLPTLPDFPGVSRFWGCSPGLPARCQILPGTENRPTNSHGSAVRLTVFSPVSRAAGQISREKRLFVSPQQLVKMFAH